MDKNETWKKLGSVPWGAAALDLGALPLLWGILGGAMMDEKERTLQKACDDADREAQYLLRMVAHQKFVVAANERGIEVDVKRALPLSEMESMMRNTLWAVMIESQRQLLVIYKEEHERAEGKWKAAAEALLHFRNEQEFLRQKRLDVIRSRVSEKYPGRTFHSYDREWIEESLAYDRECEAETQKGPPTEPAPEP